MSWQELFRAGTHTDSSGHTRTWSTADLDKVVAAYKPEFQEAPLVIGHPTTDAPAYGWLEKVKRVGEVLYGAFKQVPEAIQELVMAGRYKKKSIAFRPDYSIRHVGLLGAVPPAVAGLADMRFSAGEELAVYEFNDAGSADPANPPEDPAATEEVAVGGDTKQLEAENQGLKDKVAKLEGELAKATADLNKVSAEFSEYKGAQVKAARAARFEQLLKDGKVLPAEKADTLAFAEALGTAGEMEFAEEGGTVKAAAEERYWKGLEARQPHGLFNQAQGVKPPTGETDTQPVDASKLRGKCQGGALMTINGKIGSMTITVEQAHTGGHPVVIQSGPVAAADGLWPCGLVLAEAADGDLKAYAEYDEAAVGTGDGTDKTFEATLADVPVEPGTVAVTDGVEAFIDDGSGNLAGDAGGSGHHQLP